MKRKVVGLILFASCISWIGCSKVKSQNEANNLEVEEPINIEVGEMWDMYKLPFAFDHSIIYSEEDKKWHLYGIEGGCRTFIHLTADELTQRGWVKHEPFVYKGVEIWAPHIIKHDGLYYMYYTSIGTPRAIRLATSKDLWTWEHPSDEPILAASNSFTDNMKNKDPMVFWDEGKSQWVMYLSMLKDAKKWVVGYSTSEDLYNWTDPEICFDEDTEVPGVESPFVIKRGDKYYMFLSARPWPYGAEEIFVSDTPYHWDVKDIVKSINPWHAAEIIQDHDDKWYITRSSGDQEDFRMARFYWNGKKE